MAGEHEFLPLDSKAFDEEGNICFDKLFIGVSRDFIVNILVVYYVLRVCPWLFFPVLNRNILLNFTLVLEDSNVRWFS